MDPPNCSGNGREGDLQGQGGSPRERQQQVQEETHEVFGDVNLGFAMLFLMLLHLMQNMMRDPCTC